MEDAQKLAAEHAMTYIEVSAIDGIRVDDMINEIITQVYDLKIRPKIEAQRAASTENSFVPISNNPFNSSGRISLDKNQNN